jgi:hypothetical protein
MADHPDGIYQFTSVEIPYGVTVSFIPNAKNTPVVWLVQTTCTIAGTVDVSGKPGFQTVGGQGGPGGFRGGDGGSYPKPGQGPGAGMPPDPTRGGYGGNASFGELAGNHGETPPGPIYGNQFLIPLIGGSGGGGAPNYGGAGGGGGAILIAASQSIHLDHGNDQQILAAGASSYYDNGYYYGGAGSGGAIRLVTPKLTGIGSLIAYKGRIRFDVLENAFGAYSILPMPSQGFQPIIIPSPGETVQLSISTISGIAVANNPSGILSNPDIIIPGARSNPQDVVVHCAHIPLNNEITVVVKPAFGDSISAVGLNTAGTLESSTATIPLNLPRGGGIIYAKAAVSLTSGQTSNAANLKSKSYAETGLTAEGERFSKLEVTADLSGKQRLVYLTESGKRYPMPSR